MPEEPEPNILLEEINPYNSFKAIVEDDGRVVYMYLVPINDPEDMKALWLANREPAPDEIDLEAMEEGFPPLMHKDGCKHPDGKEAFSPADLSLVWFMEGDGVALLDKGNIYAVMPPWTGYEGFYGHCIESKTNSELAWTLEGTALGTFTERVKASQEFWRWRLNDNASPEIHKYCLAYLEAEFGKHIKIWKLEDTYFPQQAVALFKPEHLPGIYIYSTVGMSAQPMPKVEMSHEEPEDYSRIEIVAASTTIQEWIPDWLLSLCGFPWQSGMWLGDGHTVEMDPDKIHAFLTANPPAYLDEATQIDVDAPELPDFLDHQSKDPVTFLWMMQIDNPERDIAQNQGSAMLIDELARKGRGWVLK